MNNISTVSAAMTAPAIIIAAIIIGLCIIIAYFLSNKNKANDKDIKQEPIKIYPYEKKMLLTKAEYTLYNVLKKKCDENKLIICPKVRMEDFINVTSQKEKQKYRGYIKSRHIDFILCDDKLHLLGGLELDDNSHQRADVAQTDKFKEEVFKAIGLPLFRVKMSNGMYEKYIDEIIESIKSPKQ